MYKNPLTVPFEIPHLQIDYKKNKARRTKKEEPLPTHHVHQSNPLPLPRPPNKTSPSPQSPNPHLLSRTTSMKALSFHWELMFSKAAFGIMKMESQGGDFEMGG